MLGIASYDSDDEQRPIVTGDASPKQQIQFKAPPPVKAPPPSKVAESLTLGTVPNAPEAPAKATHIRKLTQLRHEIRQAKSATAVVILVRRDLEISWDARWAAEALLRIAKRSTARTRREWAVDGTVLKLNKRLQDFVDEKTNLESPPAGELVDALLVALEASRRMGLQSAGAQRPPLEKLVRWLDASNCWQGRPAASLARLLWLVAPLDIKGIDPALQLARSRADELVGGDMAQIITALQQKHMRDSALLHRVLTLLRVESAYHTMTATDMVELAEGLQVLRCKEELVVLRILGQEILRRRGELTPDENQRAQLAFGALDLPLSSVWTQPGAQKRRDKGGETVMTQAFVPREGHDKKRRGNNDISRVSPPRVVRDYKMMSY